MSQSIYTKLAVAALAASSSSAASKNENEPEWATVVKSSFPVSVVESVNTYMARCSLPFARPPVAYRPATSPPIPRHPCDHAPVQVEPEDSYDSCTLSSSEACAFEGLPQGKTTMVYPGGETRCIKGDDFAFQVVPGDTDKLIISFQGGGACWDKASTEIGAVS